MFNIFSESFLIRGTAESKQGGRKENQDSIGFADTPSGFLLVVCDGMGGGPGGKTASGLVKNYILSFVASAKAGMPREVVMRHAVAGAEKLLEDTIKKQPQLAGMGSTLVAVLINKESAVVAHLGDSRFYRIRGEKMLFRTTDHSLVAELVANKTLTEEEARTSKRSNIITRALGSTNNHEPQIDIIPYKEGDRFVLCTDGVWGVLPHKELMRRLTQQADTQNIIGMLSEEIDRVGFLRGGMHDNHTVALIEIMSNSTLQDKMSKQVKTAITAGAVILAISIIINIVCLAGAGKKTDNAAMERLKQENAQLSEYKLKYEAAQAVMGRGQQESFEENIMLKMQIDSLKRVIEAQREETAEEENSTQLAGTNRNNTQTTQNDKIANTASDTKIINDVISNLKQAKEIKDKNRTAAVKAKEKALKTTLDRLAELDKKTKGKYKKNIEALTGRINGKQKTLRYVCKDSNNYFVSTTTASGELDKLIKDAENLKKKIK